MVGVVMRVKIMFLVLVFASNVTMANTDKIKKNESVNYCHDAEKIKEWNALMAKFPNDLSIIKMYALRIGLCKAVDDKKISLETAIDVFNKEHMKVWQETFEQEQLEKSKKKITI